MHHSLQFYCIRINHCNKGSSELPAGGRGEVYERPHVQGGAIHDLPGLNITMQMVIKSGPVITVAESRKWAALALLLLCHVYFFQIYPLFMSTNEKTRFLLVSAIVDDSQVTIDSALKRWGDSQDKSRVNGHYYCDKAIGTSLLGIPVYAVLKQINHLTGPQWSLEKYMLLLRIFCVTIPAILFLFPLARFWSEIGVKASYIPHFLFLLTFGTVVFVYASEFISHHLEGMFLFLSFYFAYDHKKESSPTKLVLSGIFAGMGLITEYPAALPAFAIFLYIVSVVRSKPQAGWFIAGALPFFLGALFYNYLIFGTPFDVTYRHQNDPTHIAQHNQGFIGLGLPNLTVLWKLLFSRAHGMFFISPFLLFAAPGFYLMIRNREWRKEGILFCAVIVFYYIFHASISMWHAGWVFGPRYLTAIVPFLATGVAFYFAGENATSKQMARGVFTALGLFSVLVVTAGTITFPFADPDVRDPVFMLYFPLLFKNAGGSSLGNWIGITGLTNALIFYLVLMITYLIMVLPDGKLTVPSKSVTAGWIVSAFGGILLLLVARWTMQPMNAFEYYARASNHFFVGSYEPAMEDLEAALNRNPDEHMKSLILTRIRDLYLMAGKSAAASPD